MRLEIPHLVFPHRHELDCDPLHIVMTSAFADSDAPPSDAPPSAATPPTSSTPSASVTIRRAESHDAESLGILLADPQVFYWMTELPFHAQPDIQDLLDTSGGDRHILVASVDRGDEPGHQHQSEVVGMMSLTVCPTPRLRHTGRLGSLAIRSDYQGCGIGAQLMQGIIDLADHWLHLLRLELLVYADNETAIRFYQEYGFYQEGRLHSMAFRAGHYVDGILMARLNH